MKSKYNESSLNLPTHGQHSCVAIVSDERSLRVQVNGSSVGSVSELFNTGTANCLAEAKRRCIALHEQRSTCG